MLYLQSVFVDVDIESPNSGTRPSLCNFAAASLFTNLWPSKDMHEGNAGARYQSYSGHYSTTALISNRVGPLLPALRYARLRRREESK
jgi:hypothetical protein